VVRRAWWKGTAPCWKFSATPGGLCTSAGTAPGIPSSYW
jgi:hypothetical protein